MWIKLSKGLPPPLFILDPFLFVHGKEITGPVFATACTVLSVLENLPFSYSLLHRLLFFRHRKRNPFRASPLGYVLWISDQFLHIQSSQHFLQNEHGTPAESSPMGIAPCRLWFHMQPNIVLSFFPFLFCNSSTLPIHVQPEIHSNLYPFLKSCGPTGWFPRQYLCQKLQGYSSVNLLELHTTTAASVQPRRQKCPLQRCFTKGTKLSVVFHHHTGTGKSIKDWASICINFSTFHLLYPPGAEWKSRSDYFFQGLNTSPILCPCSAQSLSVIGSQA